LRGLLHLERKYAQIFVWGYYLFGEANSFLKTELQKNCELSGTGIVQGQMSEHIFSPNGDYCTYKHSNVFCNITNFLNENITQIFPSFSWLIFSHTFRLIYNLMDFFLLMQHSLMFVGKDLYLKVQGDL